jgi:hypothetical protein
MARLLEIDPLYADFAVGRWLVSWTWVGVGAASAIGLVPEFETGFQ